MPSHQWDGSELLSSFVKATVMCVVVGVGLIAALRLCSIVWCYCAGFSNKGLYSAAKKCVVETIGVDKINEEAKKVFADGCWEERIKSQYYIAPKGSCLDKVRMELQSSDIWTRAIFGGRDALILRFGCHYNYAWLVIVNPVDHISYDDSTVRHVTDNIVIGYESGGIWY